MLRYMELRRQVRYDCCASIAKGVRPYENQDTTDDICK